MLVAAALREIAAVFGKKIVYENQARPTARNRRTRPLIKLANFTFP